MSATLTEPREFMMSENDFEKLSELAYLYTGIVLGPQKKAMVYARLAKRLQALGLQNLAQYLPLIDAESKPEVAKFINAITTNLTSFCREPFHFEFLAGTACPAWQAEKADAKQLRIWSAGCSTGEEAYSIAMTLRENMDLNQWDCTILATDVDPSVLEQGRAGLYGIDRIESLSAERKQRWFLPDRQRTNLVRVNPSLAELISFESLNLLDAWPMKQSFDMIFCRNVALYFNEQAQATLFQRFADMLNEGGYLIIGYSEKLSPSCQRYQAFCNNVFQKIN